MGITALRHAFCVYHMPLLSQLQIKESVTEHRHPDHNKGCPGLAQPTWQSTTHGNSVCFQSKINKPVSAFLYTLTPDPDSDGRANVEERALSQTTAITANGNLSPTRLWRDRFSFNRCINNKKRTYTTSLEMIQETIALEKATGRAVCGEEFSSEWQARLSGRAQAAAWRINTGSAALTHRGRCCTAHRPQGRLDLQTDV